MNALIAAYLLPTACSLALFYGFYKLFLAKEKCFRLNRLFLVFTVLFSLILPFITISFETGKAASDILVYQTLPWVEIHADASYSTSSTPWLLYIYWGIASLLSGRLLLFLTQLFLVIARNSKERKNGLIIVRHTYRKHPYLMPFPEDTSSFFKFVFLADENYTEEEIRMILTHEKQHYMQGHTLDTLLFECLVILQFFNPFAWLFRREIKLNHEYLADQAALQTSESKPLYFSLLLRASLQNPSLLTHPFSQSPIKKRIIMQTQPQNPLHGRLKLLLALPLITALLFFFACNQTEKKEDGISSEVTSVKASETEDDIYHVVEENPGFPGGELARMKFLQENLRYPEDARKADVEGTVFVTFVIDKDGSITNPAILKGIYPSIDEEVLRLLSVMPRWNPGKHEGKAVKVQFNMPIRFALSSEAPPPPALPTEAEWEAKSKANQAK